MANNIQDDPSAAPTAYVTAFFTVIFVITVVALTAYFGHAQSREEQKKLVEVPAEARDAALMNQQQQISEYRRDPETGQVAIPIDRAMELVAAELAATPR